MTARFCLIAPPTNAPVTRLMRSTDALHDHFPNVIALAVQDCSGRCRPPTKPRRPVNRGARAASPSSMAKSNT